MKISTDHETLRVSDVQEFNEPDVDVLIRDIRQTLKPTHSIIEFDLAHIRSADCDTVDAVLAIYEEFDRESPARVWRMVNLAPELRQLFELVRLHHLFEITSPHPSGMILS